MTLLIIGRIGRVVVEVAPSSAAAGLCKRNRRVTLLAIFIGNQLPGRGCADRLILYLPDVSRRIVELLKA